MRRLVDRHSRGTVISGPFQGMRYAVKSQGSAQLPKVLGTYELELHSLLGSLEQTHIHTVYNIGAAEGYYAVGLARMFPAADVIAWELNERGHSAIREMARANGCTDRISVRGACSVEDLARNMAGQDGDQRSLVICDVEGYEDVLLNPDEVSGLRDAIVCVESHDHLVPEISTNLAMRFRETHDITRVPSQRRVKSDFPFRAWWQTVLPRRYAMYPVDELRLAPICWLWMVPKDSQEVLPS